MESKDTKAQDFENSNTELIKSILVGMAVEANIATLQRINPSRVYKAINDSAVANSNFIIGMLKLEREDGIKEGVKKGKKDFGKRSRAQMRYYLKLFNANNKDEKIEDEKIMSFVEMKNMEAEVRCGTEEKTAKGSDKIEGSHVICPYCGEASIDKMALKNHLQYQCKEFINQPEA